MAGTDRRVHARLADGREVVRYNRAGKWYVEAADARRAVGVLEAARVAVEHAGEIRYGLPGGSHFDAAVRQGRRSS